MEKDSGTKVRKKIRIFGHNEAKQTSDRMGDNGSWYVPITL